MANNSGKRYTEITNILLFAKTVTVAVNIYWCKKTEPDSHSNRYVCECVCDDEESRFIMETSSYIMLQAYNILLTATASVLTSIYEYIIAQRKSWNMKD